MRLRIRSSLTLTVTSGFEVLGRLPHLPTYHAATNTRRRPATPEKSVKRSPTVGKAERGRGRARALAGAAWALSLFLQKLRGSLARSRAQNDQPTTMESRGIRAAPITVPELRWPVVIERGVGIRMLT